MAQNLEDISTVAFCDTAHCQSGCRLEGEIGVPIVYQGAANKVWYACRDESVANRTPA
jgi:hypothetical protein